MPDTNDKWILISLHDPYSLVRWPCVVRLFSSFLFLTPDRRPSRFTRPFLPLPAVVWHSEPGGDKNKSAHTWHLCEWHKEIHPVGCCCPNQSARRQRPPVGRLMIAGASSSLCNVCPLCTSRSESSAGSLQHSQHPIEWLPRVLGRRLKGLLRYRLFVFLPDAFSYQEARSVDWCFIYYNGACNKIACLLALI
jgi:hypothetical protein